MIIDSSAAIAVLNDEPEAAQFITMLGTETSRIGAPTLMEAALVANPTRTGDLDRLIADFRIEVVPFTAEHAAVAREAHLRYGRGAHNRSRARLNFGDCMAYAVAKVAGEPLLFKGDDFTHTDIEAAL